MEYHRMRHTLLTSMQNDRVKQLVKLRDRRARDETGLFLIEGYRELSRAVDAGVAVEALYICPELFLGAHEGGLIERALQLGGQLFVCSAQVFQKISYRDRPDGLIAVAAQHHRTLVDLESSLKRKKASPPFLIVAEAIEKPGNLGTILRSSDAVGLDGVVVCDRCTDIYNPNVVRASVGTLFTVPVVESGSEEALQWLKEQGIAVVAATPSAEKEYTQVDMTGPVAIAVGTEQLGLSPVWMENADIQVRIPMLGIADSLNVATATTLLLYEVVRQRRGVGR